MARPGRRALARELGARDADVVGPPDRRDQGAAARGRRRRRAGCRAGRSALGARGRRVADRPVRGGARAARARALAPRRAAWPQSMRERDDFPHAVAEALAFDRRARPVGLHRGGRGGRRLVRDARRLSRGCRRRRHRARPARCSPARAGSQQPLPSASCPSATRRRPRPRRGRPRSARRPRAAGSREPRR